MYDHDLRNVLGNLLARATSPKLSNAIANARLYVRPISGENASQVSYPSLLNDVEGKYGAEDKEIKQMLVTTRADVERLMDDFEFGRALERINECLVKACLNDLLSM